MARKEIEVCLKNLGCIEVGHYHRPAYENVGDHIETCCHAFPGNNLDVRAWHTLTAS
jgi:hypothetical protein